jgi:serine protease Do
LPAVVSIEVTSRPAAIKKNQPRRRPNQDDERVPEEFRRFFDDFGGQFPDENDAPQHGFGSGFIVDPSGVVLTNNHVVDGAEQAEVRLQDGRKFIGRDIKVDPKSDLAILRIQADKPLPYLELGDSSQMEQGDRVLAFGAPYGLTGSVTAGIVSAKGRTLGGGRLRYEDFLQTDAPINPGNSGGPLVNLEGKVVGINSAIKSRSGGWQGVGLAVSSNLAKDVMEKLERFGVVRRGYLGVAIKDLLDRDLAQRLGSPEGGVVVSQSYENAPAAKGGIKGGDIIVALAGQPIREGRALQNTVAGLPLGRPVGVKVIRDGKPVTLHVKVEEQPQDYGNDSPRFPRVPKPDDSAITLNSIGAEAMDLTPDLAKEMHLTGVTEGAVVIRVKRDSAAAEAGFFPGLVVTRVDKKPITSAADLRDALKGSALKNGALVKAQSTATGTIYSILREAGAK